MDKPNISFESSLVSSLIACRSRGRTSDWTTSSLDATVCCGAKRSRIVLNKCRNTSDKSQRAVDNFPSPRAERGNKLVKKRNSETQQAAASLEEITLASPTGQGFGEKKEFNPVVTRKSSSGEVSFTNNSPDSLAVACNRWYN